MDLEKIKNKASEEILAARGLKELDKVYKKYLGKKGEIANVFALLKQVSGQEKKQLGKRANLVKQELADLISQKTEAITQQKRQLLLEKEKIDITRPGQKASQGHLHPLTLVQRECCDIFQTMGFEVVRGPEVETEWYNFDALNMPKDHPARDMQDTFWLKQPEKAQEKLLPRTQTSPVQIRYMEKHQPPLKIVAPGRVFRNEATDASHEVQFYQLEGLMVDEQISTGNFKYIIESFLKRFFKTDVRIRLRPSFFPFTEPSFEIDVKRGAGDWLELMGAGMVHQNVFKAAGLAPSHFSQQSAKSGRGWQGFAFGVGLDRLAMIKYKIPDIRLLYQNDLRFLNQF